MLDTLGEAKYKTLLRRVASDPPFKKVTKEIRDCAFLLGYLVMDEETAPDSKDAANIQKAQFVLAQAEDVYIVDNSFLRRQFSMLVSPMEQQLEEFYNLVGSRYVSEVVKKAYEVDGRNQRNTALTKKFASRISERRPLLLSPSISSRPLAPNGKLMFGQFLIEIPAHKISFFYLLSLTAAKLLSDECLEFVEVDAIHAKYTFDRSSKSIPTTSCARPSTKDKTTIFITHNFDWFDVGTAIGGLILKRCQLEDAFFLSSILEASLDTLRHRGFPVDRVLRPVLSPPPPPPPPPVPTPTTVPTNPTNLDNTHGGTRSKMEEQSSNSGFDSILSQMFPLCPPDVIQGMLGSNPTKEKARDVANQLASMNVPSPHDGVNYKDTQNGSEHRPKTAPGGSSSNSNSEQTEQAHTKAPKKKATSIMGRMMGGLRPSSSDRSSHPGKQRVVHQHAGSGGSQNNTPTSPENDAVSQQSLEAMLQDSVQSTRSVQSAGVSAPETLLKSLPQGFECGSDGCEVIPQQNIHPFPGPYGNGASNNGIRVFNARSASTSFLTNNFDAVDSFSTVIQHLTVIYKLSLSTVAIYYDPSGNTIAFNSNKALYFNVRFFASLHRHRVDATCYSYWFTVMAHELAHNLVTAHNKEHGKFTESIIALYLPEFVRLLAQFK